MAVDGVAVGGVEDVADDGAGYLRGTDHGSALGLDPPRTQPAQGAAGSFLADIDGVFQQQGGALGGVPVVALHVAIVVVGDGLRGKAAVGAAELAGKAARVDQDLVRRGGVEVASAGVADARVVGQGGGLADARDFDAG